MKFKITNTERMLLYNDLLKLAHYNNCLDYYNLFITESDYIINYAEEKGNLNNVGCKSTIDEDFPKIYEYIINYVNNLLENR